MEGKERTLEPVIEDDGLPVPWYNRQSLDSPNQHRPNGRSLQSLG